ncbi:MAG TPA: winged helix-turn-helix domain-containing protein [Candidatus Acidoferrales bacterium]|nr:winged helix-turn-helix domain-containing protein [Candidatus Acidoferrales bacterium]
MTSLSVHDSVNAIENLQTHSGRFRFGVFEVDASRSELRKQGIRIKLQEKPFQLLVLLLKHAGNTATREGLRRGLWPADTFVAFDANLKTAVNKVRQALGDSVENPIFIETIPRQGYRFLVPVVTLESEPSSVEDDQKPPVKMSKRVFATFADSFATLNSSWSSRILAILFAAALIAASFYMVRKNSALTPGRRAQRVILLVLPFENLSGDPEQEYFSDGLTDELITVLSRQFSNGVAVIARTSAMHYRGTQRPLQVIARELGGVDYALEGTVRRSGNHIGINAHLFRVQDQATVWADTYECDLGDLMVIQHDVAERFARSLMVQVVPSRGSNPP